MAIFDFFKKPPKFKEAEEVKLEKLTLPEVKPWLEDKKKENSLKEKNAMSLIQAKIKIFTEEIKDGVKTLEAFNLESRKAEEKIKFIVSESRKKYIEFIETFLDNLNALEMNDLEKVTREINNLFLNFNNRLHVSYEKTTILIGKEMAEIKNCLKEFSKELLNIFDGNKGIIESSKILTLLESKLNQLPILDETLKATRKSINSLRNKMISKNEEHKQLTEEIESIKKSEVYLQYLGNQEKIKFLEENLKKEYLTLKQLFDFKAMSSFFHADSEKMKVLNDYKERFQEAFEKENGRDILGLAEDASLNTEKISEKIKQIQIKLCEIDNIMQGIKQDPTKETHSELIHLIREITDLEMELFREEKKYEKLDANKKNLIDFLKQEMEKLGAELIF